MKRMTLWCGCAGGACCAKTGAAMEKAKRVAAIGFFTIMSTCDLGVDTSISEVEKCCVNGGGGLVSGAAIPANLRCAVGPAVCGEMSNGGVR